MHYLEFQKWFDERFSILLKKRSDDFTSYSESPSVAAIVYYTKEIAKDGKRFRPFLVYSASELKNEDIEEHFLLFASIELLHIFALIHDDIMDEADTRHGVICTHKKFNGQYGEKIGESIGILLGDLFLLWAYECLFEYTNQFPNFRNRITEEFSRLVKEVTHGQMLDILSPVQSPLDKKTIINKMTLKTARYSFVQPLHLGFVIQGDNSDNHIFAEEFGLSLGIGFQLQDDLLNTLKSEETGKTQFSDIQNGNQTILSNYILNSKQEYSEEFKTIFGKPLDKNKIEDISLLLKNSGAISYIEKLIKEYFEQAHTTVKINRAKDNEKWNAIIQLVEKRKK